MAKNNKAAWARTGLALLACLYALVTAAAWPATWPTGYRCCWASR